MSTISYVQPGQPFYGTANTETIQGTPYDDEIHGGSNGNKILAGAGNDQLWGDGGDDNIFGEEGNDTFYATDLGKNAFTGGTGNDHDGLDLAVFSGHLNAEGTASDDYSINTFEGYVETSNVNGSERLTTYHPTSIIVHDRADPDNHSWKLKGIYEFDFGSSKFYWNGEHFSPTVSTTNGNDSFHAGTAGNYQFAYKGDDVMTGNIGNDIFFGGDGNDSLSGHDGNDWLDGGTGQNKLYGGDGNDYLTSASGGSVLHGNSGNDQLILKTSVSDPQSDLDGGSGNDVLDFRSAASAVHAVGGTGNDTIRAGSGNDDISGQAGADQFVFDFSHVGKDELKDFQPGTDHLYILSQDTDAPVHSFDELVNGGHLISDSHGNAEIVFGDETVRLHHVAVANLHSSDFVFDVYA